MQIFFLSTDPAEAAERLCNKHVVKMIVESTQLLYTAHHVGGTSEWLGELKVYRATHRHHPMCRWVCAAKTHYRWLLDHARALVRVFQRRYPDSKAHACGAHLDRLEAMAAPSASPDTAGAISIPHATIATRNPPAGCAGAPLCFEGAHHVRHGSEYDLVASYRKYYAHKRTVIPMSWSPRPRKRKRARH